MLKPLNAEAEALGGFRWAAEEIGTRHQLGGTPRFLQPLHWPECTHCHSAMSFYGQLDSVSDEFAIADCGMIYVFFCFGCNESYSVVQSA